MVCADEVGVDVVVTMVEELVVLVGATTLVLLVLVVEAEVEVTGVVVVVAPSGVVLGVAVKVSVWPWLLLTMQPKKLLAPVMHTLSSGQHSPLPQSMGPMGGHTPWSCRAAWNWIAA